MSKSTASGLVVVSALLSAGCIQTVTPVTAARLPATRVFQRNYRLGVSQSVFVGQPVVAFKDYVVFKRQGGSFRPNTDFRVKQYIDPWRAVSANTEYVARGELTIEGVLYKALRIATGYGYDIAVLIDPTGHVYNKLLNNDQFILGTATFEPPDIVFSPSALETVVDTSATFQNFELLYGGTDGRSFTLTYREYTPQDLIKPAFTQTLTFVNSSPSIRFRNIKIDIHEVSSEGLTYTVAQDESDRPRQ